MCFYTPLLQGCVHIADSRYSVDDACVDPRPVADETTSLSLFGMVKGKVCILADILRRSILASKNCSADCRLRGNRMTVAIERMRKPFKDHHGKFVQIAQG